MATTWPARLAALALAVLALVATRVPGAGPWSTIAVGGGVLTVAAAAWSLSKRAPIGLRSTAVLLGLGLLLVPTSETAWLGAVPDVAVAILFVFAMHVFYTAPDNMAPVLGSADGRPWYHGLVRAIPAICASILLLALPWISAWVLPARIHAAYELQSALGPVAFLVVMAAILIVGGLLWTAFDRTTASDPKKDHDHQMATDEGGRA